MTRHGFRDPIRKLIGAALIWGLAPPVAAQCPAPVGTFCSMLPNPSHTLCYQAWPTATGPMGCAITMSTGVTLCQVATMLSDRLEARAMSSSLPHVRSCQAACSCGTIRLDNANGLPVELLGFELEEAQAGAGIAPAAEPQGPDPG